VEMKRFSRSTRELKSEGGLMIKEMNVLTCNNFNSRTVVQEAGRGEFQATFYL
jgi:hypothetical protein